MTDDSAGRKEGSAPPLCIDVPCHAAQAVEDEQRKLQISSSSNDCCCSGYSASGNYDYILTGNILNFPQFLLLHPYSPAGGNVRCSKCNTSADSVSDAPLSYTICLYNKHIHVYTNKHTRFYYLLTLLLLLPLVKHYCVRNCCCASLIFGPNSFLVAPPAYSFSYIQDMIVSHLFEFSLFGQLIVIDGWAG